jgi:hypothetical protein
LHFVPYKNNNDKGEQEYVRCINIRSKGKMMLEGEVEGDKEKTGNGSAEDVMSLTPFFIILQDIIVFDPGINKINSKGMISR